MKWIVLIYRHGFASGYVIAIGPYDDHNRAVQKANSIPADPEKEVIVLQLNTP